MAEEPPLPPVPCGCQDLAGCQPAPLLAAVKGPWGFPANHTTVGVAVSNHSNTERPGLASLPMGL